MEVVFIPECGVGHIRSMVEFAKLLVHRDQRISVTILIMQDPFNRRFKGFIQSLFSTSVVEESSNSRINFIQLPPVDDPDVDHLKRNPHSYFTSFIDNHKPLVRDAVDAFTRPDSPSRLAAIVVDMFTTSMVELAHEIGVPAYVYFTSSASYLAFVFHFRTIFEEYGKDLNELKELDYEFCIPGFVNPIPSKLLPYSSMTRSFTTLVINQSETFKKTDGIIVNTFSEIESYALAALYEAKTPPIYPVGPILSPGCRDCSGDEEEINPQFDTLMKWLNDQPASAVVFLCFGSMGCFEEYQVKEIALALERSKHRFLWSLRRPPEIGKLGFPVDYNKIDEILSEGFLERTADRGKVIGWAPQLEVLSHQAIGGFVSHCGWNSMLESIWCGIPIATWPLHAEQQMNAFQIVKELEMGVEVKMDFKWKSKAGENRMVLTADHIENSIKKLMNTEEDEDGNERKRKVKEMKDKSRAAMAEGGSSYSTLKRLIEDIAEKVSQVGENYTLSPNS